MIPHVLSTNGALFPSRLAASRPTHYTGSVKHMRARTQRDDTIPQFVSFKTNRTRDILGIMVAFLVDPLENVGFRVVLQVGHLDGFLRKNARNHLVSQCVLCCTRSVVVVVAIVSPIALMGYYLSVVGYMSILLAFPGNHASHKHEE